MKRIDIFPAVLKVTPPGTIEDLASFDFDSAPPLGTRKLDRTRVVILNNTLMVVIDSPSGPSLIFQDKVQEEIHDKKISKIRTVSDKVMIVKKDDNCGCGSRLRGWNPYGNIVGSSFDPVE